MQSLCAWGTCMCSRVIYCYFLTQFCDFNSIIKPEDVCKVISYLQSDGQSYDCFGKLIPVVCVQALDIKFYANYVIFFVHAETASLYSIMWVHRSFTVTDKIISLSLSLSQTCQVTLIRSVTHSFWCDHTLKFWNFFYMVSLILDSQPIHTYFIWVLCTLM